MHTRGHRRRHGTTTASHPHAGATAPTTNASGPLSWRAALCAPGAAVGGRLRPTTRSRGRGAVGSTRSFRRVRDATTVAGRCVAALPWPDRATPGGSVPLRRRRSTSLVRASSRGACPCRSVPAAWPGPVRVDLPLRRLSCRNHNRAAARLSRWKPKPCDERDSQSLRRPDFPTGADSATPLLKWSQGCHSWGSNTNLVSDSFPAGN